MDQSRLIAPFGQYVRHPVLLADMGLGHVLDPHPVLVRQHLRLRPYALTQGFGKARVVEDPDMFTVEKCRHTLGKAHARQRPGDDDPVIAIQDAL